MQEKRVICPFCGYAMPVFFGNNSQCSALKMQCKGRKCRKTFEIKIEKGKQIR